MKKILITGAGGFIGGFLVEEALKRNYEVYAGIRSTSSKTYLTHPDIKFLNVDLSDKNVLCEKLRTFDKFDYVIHNAGITKALKKEDFDKVNFKSTQNLIEALNETVGFPDKFIYISSLEAFGPGNEDTLQPIKDSDDPKPISKYGESKLKAERYIKSIETLPHLIFRPTGVYGPREKDYFLLYKGVKMGIETYVGTSEQYITFIYVKDLARLIFDAVESTVSGKSYFATDLKQYTAKEFNNVVKEQLNKKTIRIIFPKLFVKTLAFINEKIYSVFRKVPTLNTEKYKIISCKNWLCDSSAIRNDFGFIPKYDLKKGIKEAITWYKKEKLL
ncbi:MAG: NAD(P)-dependent oxidoreductase [Bacteroidales bacterium]|nr:NAD(P)-dependent oxidoreductase [Bacteroidales bacterium]